MASMPTFESYASEQRAAGFDEVLERRWPANQVLETHTHPYGAQGAVYWAARRRA